MSNYKKHAMDEFRAAKWLDEDGKMSKSYYTGRESSVPIEFPYTPKTEYVFSPTEQYPNEVIE